MNTFFTVIQFLNAMVLQMSVVENSKLVLQPVITGMVPYNKQY